MAFSSPCRVFSFASPAWLSPPLSQWRSGFMLGLGQTSSRWCTSLKFMDNPLLLGKKFEQDSSCSRAEVLALYGGIKAYQSQKEVWGLDEILGQKYYVPGAPNTNYILWGNKCCCPHLMDGNSTEEWFFEHPIQSVAGGPATWPAHGTCGMPRCRNAQDSESPPFHMTALSILLSSLLYGYFHQEHSPNFRIHLQKSKCHFWFFGNHLLLQHELHN